MSDCLFCAGTGQQNEHRYDNSRPLDRAINESNRYQALLFQAWRAMRSQTKGLQRQRRLIKRLQAELALTVARAENAERALVEADERHSRYVKAVGELAGMAARLAEAEHDAARYREVWNSWPLTFGEMLQNGYGVYPIANKAQGDAAIDDHLSRKEGET